MRTCGFRTACPQVVLGCRSWGNLSVHLVVVLASPGAAPSSFTCTCGLANCDHVLCARTIDPSALAHHAPWRAECGPAYALLAQTATQAQYFFLDRHGTEATVQFHLEPDWNSRLCALVHALQLPDHADRWGFCSVLQKLREAHLENFAYDAGGGGGGGGANTIDLPYVRALLSITRSHVRHKPLSLRSPALIVVT